MTDWASAASAVFAGAGLVFTGTQVRHISNQAKEDRKVALEGVAVAWRALEAPDHPSASGDADWLYEFIANNPGRLPIDDVVVKVRFPCEVQRIRYSGRLGEPTRVLTMRTPVLLGGGQREWKRRLRINFSEAASLKDTYAEISFRDVKLRVLRNRWPRVD